MSEHPRVSNETCPVCGADLGKPWLEGDWQDWDCYRCGLSVPSMVMVTGKDLLDLARLRKDPRGFLEKLGFQPLTPGPWSPKKNP